jgi:transcriptional regulator with PAS, ATPase and Fis domain
MRSSESGKSLLPSALPEGGVLVVSGDTIWRDRVIQDLRGQEHLVGIAGGGADALHRLDSGHWSTLLLERELVDLDARDVAEFATRKYPKLAVRFLDSCASTRTHGAEVEPIHAVWPQSNCPPEHRMMESEPCRPGPQARPEPLPGMVGVCQPMLRLYEMARRVAKRTTTILISGATGTGKDVLARSIHQLSPRASRPFVVVNCAAIPEALLESELFGYVRGAFTGAVQSQAGRISAANGGTLFLDEVGELPLSMQAKLLRFIEMKEIQRLGSAELSRVDVRIIAATNNDLSRRVSERQFRQDLFYRLAVFSLELPLLRDRGDDILPLARHFLANINRSGLAVEPSLSPGAIRMLHRHSWPGNVRELQLVLERACILSEGESEIRTEHICFPGGEQRAHAESERQRVAV